MRKPKRKMSTHVLSPAAFQPWLPMPPARSLGPAVPPRPPNAYKRKEQN